jgi:polyribonucleotide nucleotidyltransferase
VRDVIGPGGKMIRSIVDKTGCKIDILDDGRVHIASMNKEAADQAMQLIRELTMEIEVGKTYVGRVSRLTEFGAFVEIVPGTEALLHISEVAPHRVRDIREVLKEGDIIKVKCIANDGMGRIRLSRKALLVEQERSARKRPEERPRAEDRSHRTRR